MSRAWRAVPLVMLISGCEKVWLDAQLEEYCAKDGGVKVYEKVVLPPEKFDRLGAITFYRPTQGENALGPEYLFKEQKSYYRKGNPEAWRNHYQVIRRSDRKLLGESISYSRRGGDGAIPLPMHDSSFGCPKNAGDASLLRLIFVPGN